MNHFDPSISVYRGGGGSNIYMYMVNNHIKLKSYRNMQHLYCVYKVRLYHLDMSCFSSSRCYSEDEYNQNGNTINSKVKPG